MKRRASALAQWSGLGALVGVACGAASAAFLIALDLVTRFRGNHEAIVYALPVAGLVVGAIYERWGQSIKGGNNLIIDTIHLRSADTPAGGAPGAATVGAAGDAPQIPLRMAPMVLIGTLITHLFGGSAGREGTAVQMGASLADEIAHRFAVGPALRRQLLAAGIAGGFGSVFGTPIAGTLFGLEVVAIGRMEYDALVPALIAALVGDFTTRKLGVVHTAYPAMPSLELGPILLAKLAVIGVAMALATMAFVELTHRLKKGLEARVPRLPVRMFLGGLAVVALWKLVGTSDYLGLGVPTIVRAFTDPRLASYAFAAKLVFTAITLSAGFLGGEVTPLFFVGATLGSVLARLLGLPLELGAGVGIAAVFGAAANTPIALSVMAAEILGGAAFPHVVIVTVIAYLLSGHRGIYPAQRLARRKHGGRRIEPPVALRSYQDDEPPA
jgi:H+/Cl- antiporter ClcA